MPTVKYRPITPSRRFITTLDFSDLSDDKPLRSLLETKKRTGGRNNRGRITSRYIGGGHKRRYRVIDFNRRDKEGVPGKIATIEYDPNRSANIARLHYMDGEKRYVLAPHGAKVGDTLMSGKNAEIRNGNSMPMENMPLGTLVHNVELKIGRGGKMARSAGSYAQIMARESGYVQLRVPSGEIRKVRQECYATIGQVSNVDHENITIGKAGRTRWLGRRGHVRGAAMNPVDHPHGGGEGKTTGGRHPVTPWGVSTKGKKTRKNKRTSQFIVQRRKHRKKK